MTPLRVLLALALLIPIASPQQVTEGERQRFEQIKARHDRGEPVTAEEREFAQRVIQRMNQAQAAARNQGWAKLHPPRESTGLIPLPDLGRGFYHGESGGLYPGGKNTHPTRTLRRPSRWRTVSCP